MKKINTVDRKDFIGVLGNIYTTYRYIEQVHK